MGQSMKSKGGGLMQALAQALMADMSEFKVAVFETLAAAARWPSLKGQVAGSGVLGVITATLLAPRHPPPVKALMVRLSAALAVDSPECVRLQDPKREEEFAKLRAQLLSSGALAAIAGMVDPSSPPLLTAAAAGAVATFAGVGSDADTRAALAKSAATARLLACLPGSGLEAAAGAQGDSQHTGPAGEGAGATGEGTAAEAGRADSEPKESSTEVADASSVEDEKNEDDAYTLTQVLTALGRLAGAEGDGADAILQPLREPCALARLRALLAQGDVAREVVEQASACLAALGRRAAAWPEVDEGLSADLARLIICGSDSARHLLAALVEDRGRAVQLGDLRPLRRAAKQQRADAASRALDALPGCEQCGRASEKSLLLCTGCHKVEYCSRDCQKAAWKVHKTVCAKGAKK